MGTITPLTLKMLQVRANRVHTRISFFVSKTVREIREFFYPWPKYSWSESTQAQPTDGWRAIDRACPQGLQRPWEKFGSARLSRKKANFVDSGKLLLRGYKFKETKHDRCGKRPAATEVEEIDDRSTEEDVNALRRSIKLFLFFFLRRLTTFDCVSCFESN